MDRQDKVKGFESRSRIINRHLVPFVPLFSGDHVAFTGSVVAEREKLATKNTRNTNTGIGQHLDKAEKRSLGSQDDYYTRVGARRVCGRDRLFRFCWKDRSMIRRARFHLLMAGIAVFGCGPIIPSARAQITSGAEVSRDADKALAYLEVYPGLEARLFASEPMIASPTNIDVDERGRVWVCDVMNYREHAQKGAREGGDRILILEDSDGDGKADKSTVFYQGRDVDAALGICVLANEYGHREVIVSAAPNIWRFVDVDGDDIPDEKTAILTKTGRAQSDHSTHSVVFGPDGRYYWNFGNSGYAVHRGDGRLVYDRRGLPVIDKLVQRQGGPWEHLESPYAGGMAFRCDRHGRNFDVLGHNFRNNYELAVDSFGNVWQTDNDDDGSDGCRINYVMQGGNFGYRDEITGQSWRIERPGQHAEIPWRHWHQNDPGVVPNFIQTGAGSPTGITVYEGRLLPEVFWDQVIACDAGPGVVWAAHATKDGAGFRGQLIPILKTRNDRWFRPVDVSVAPDGSLFVSDWYDPYVGWNRQGDRARGRIYRIAPRGHRYGAADSGELAGSENAAAHLRSPNAALRSRGWHHAGDDDLAGMFKSEANPRLRARALWRMIAKAETNPNLRDRLKELVGQALADPDEDIRIVGLRAAQLCRFGLLEAAEKLIRDPSAQVRRECALLLRDQPSPRAARLWAELALRHDGKDRWYLEALGIGAEGNWDACFEAWLEKIDAKEEKFTKAERDIIWRSRARKTSGYLQAILGDPLSYEEGFARYIRALDFLPDTVEKRAVLHGLAFGSPTSSAAGRNEIRLEALLRFSKLEPENDDWLATLRVAEGKDPKKTLNWLISNPGDTPRERQAFVRLVDRFELRQAFATLLELALDNIGENYAGQAVRVLLEDAQSRRDLARQLMDSARTDPDLALSLIKLFHDAQDSRATPILLPLVGAGSEPDQSVKEAAVRALASTHPGIEAMVNLARKGEFPTALKETAGAAISHTMNVNLRAEAAQWFPMPPLKGTGELAQLTELLVFHGDSERGKKVFETATCATCHVVDGKGIEYGPDLSKIGSKLGKKALYEAILDPSSGISPSYQVHELTLADGEKVVGLWEGDSDGGVTVRQPGGLTRMVKRSNIARRQALPASAMPANLQLLMSQEELIDLVEYLTRLR